MENKEQNKVSAIVEDILGGIWAAEKSTWRTASRLGLIGGVLFFIGGGFIGNYLYGWLGMLGGAVAGAIGGWFIFALIFYFLMSTASFFS